MQYSASVEVACLALTLPFGTRSIKRPCNFNYRRTSFQQCFIRAYIVLSERDGGIYYKVFLLCAFTVLGVQKMSVDYIFMSENLRAILYFI